jgi:putative hemolysin
MSNVIFECGVIVLLTLLNGFFALAEMSLVSARKSRLQELANEGSRGAKIALKLTESPDHLLSTVQLGITLIGIVSGVYGGATLAVHLAGLLERVPHVGTIAEPLALSIIVLLVTYATIVVGELVPKRLALTNPARTAALVAPLMLWLSRLMAPFVAALNVASKPILRALRLSEGAAGAQMSTEEIKIIVEQGAQAGVVEEVEQDIVNRALELGERRIDSLMTPRRDVVWLEKTATFDEVIKIIGEAKHTHYPVCENTIDNVKGMVGIKELWALRSTDGAWRDWSTAMRPPFCVPGTTNAVKILEQFKLRRESVACVVDEYGGLDGLISITDVLKAVFVDLPLSPAEEDPIVERADGTWLVSGAVSLFDFEEHFEISLHEGEDEEVAYQTLAGFVITMLGHVPKVSEAFTYRGLRFEVVDMDGNRVDKVLVAFTPEVAALKEIDEE